MTPEPHGREEAETIDALMTAVKDFAQRQTWKRLKDAGYISDLDPDVLRMLTQRKVVAYLRHRRAAAVARGDYTLEVVERRRTELVTPEQPDGVRIDLPPRETLWGRMEFALSSQDRRGVAPGRSGR